MGLKIFFDEIPGGNYTSSNYAGGILHHWIWNGVDKVDEIGDFLLKKGYIFRGRTPAQAMTSGAMKKHLTRVEMNSLYKSNFSVEYFDGNGSMYCKHYFNTNRLLMKVNILTVISILGSVASIIGMILSAIK